MPSLPCRSKPGTKLRHVIVEPDASLFYQPHRRQSSLRPPSSARPGRKSCRASSLLDAGRARVGRRPSRTARRLRDRQGPRRLASASTAIAASIDLVDGGKAAAKDWAVDRSAAAPHETAQRAEARQQANERRSTKPCSCAISIDRSACARLASRELRRDLAGAAAKAGVIR